MSPGGAAALSRPVSQQVALLWLKSLMSPKSRRTVMTSLDGSAHRLLGSGPVNRPCWIRPRAAGAAHVSPRDGPSPVKTRVPGVHVAMTITLWVSGLLPLVTRGFPPKSHLICTVPRGVFSAIASASRQHSSDAKVRSYLHYLRRKIKPPPSPPYSHVCQVGDPVLRGCAEAVDPREIRGPEVQKVIGTLVKVMRRLECVGLSAPQIGVPLRILALEFPERAVLDVPPAGREARGLTPVELRVFVNPQLRVLDSRTASFMEACESISGFSACVARYLSVEVSGLNEMAEPVTWQASGWPARILQHEMDHLDGVLYVDRMDSRTFTNVNWAEHND
ncbi:peptide deformylase, mitochondrial isoform X1 [Arapaima gigas]